LYGVKKNELEVVKFCFRVNEKKNYFNIDMRGKNEMTCLHYASAFSGIEIVKLLLTKGKTLELDIN